jgi:hypothetical protein
VSGLDDLLGNIVPEQSSYSMPMDPLYGAMYGSVSPAGGPPGTGGPANPGNMSGNNYEQMARQMAAKKYGWGQGDFRFIDWIIGGGGPNNVTAESSWNPKAVNPSSGAYGIPQILPSAHPGVNLQNNPQGQIRWLLNYIKGRYGTPQDAYQFKSNKGWY